MVVTVRTASQDYSATYPKHQPICPQARGRGDQEKGLVAVLEMTRPSLSPSDRILWILANHGNMMERSRLRVATEMRYAILNPVLEELARKVE